MKSRKNIGTTLQLKMLKIMIVNTLNESYFILYNVHT